MARGGREQALRIGLNLLYVEPGATGGMEVYARRLAPALAAARPQATLTLFASRELAAELRARPLVAGARVVGLPASGATRVRRIAVEQALLGAAARRAGVEVLHSLASTAPALTPGVVRVLTVHDLIHRTHPEAHAGPLAAGLRLLVGLSARRAHAVIAVSEAARREVVELLALPAQRVAAIPNGPGHEPGPATPGAELRRRLGLGDAPLVLCVSAKRAHKNLLRLLDALAASGASPAPTLVLVGYPTDHEAALRERAGALGLGERVRFLGWVDDADLEGLYREARLLAFPSLAEGFGLPVLEAMRRGLPVACSDIGPLAEVAGDAARRFDPLSVAQIAAALDALLGDEALRAQLVRRGHERAARYSWEATAHATLAVYDRALAWRSHHT